MTTVTHHAFVVDLDPPKKPCAECPWRTDVCTGHFPPERFIALANTAYDMADHVFTCHKSAPEHPIACAGFLQRGADHNKTVRIAKMLGKLAKADRSGGYTLFSDFRAMAIANGVPPEHPALVDCRSNSA